MLATYFTSLIIFISLGVTSLAVEAFAPFTDVSQDNTEKYVSNYFSMARNNSEAIDVDDVVKLSINEWTEYLGPMDSFELKAGSNWFSFDIVNNSADVKTISLMVENHFQLAQTKLFSYSVGRVIQPVKLRLSTGNIVAGFIPLLPFSTQTLYLSVDSDTEFILPIKFVDETTFYHLSNQSQFGNGYAIGGMVSLTLVILLIFVTSGLKSILLLFGYFLSQTALLSTLLGEHLYFILPNIPELTAIDLPFFTITSSIFIMLFTAELFELKSKYINIYQMICIFCALLLLCIPCSFMLSVSLNLYMSMMIYGIATSLLVFIGVYLIKEKLPLSFLFTGTSIIQFVFFLLSLLAVHFYGLACFKYKSIFYGLSFGVHAFLIIFIVSRQYYNRLDDQHKVQQQALESAIASRHAHEALLALQQDNQDELEIRVQERTLELNIALQELENSNHELALKNTQDDLSGLYNRRFYDQKILAEFRRSKRNLTPLSLVLIDIDHFKRVNDTYGHLAGDQCITWLGKVIKDSLKRSTDLGCRYGGEEFCLILPDTDHEGAAALAELIRNSIASKPYIYLNTSINLTISCGISTYVQQKNIQPEQMFSGADKALYLAKNQGRNRVQQHIFIDG